MRLPLGVLAYMVFAFAVAFLMLIIAVREIVVENNVSMAMFYVLLGAIDVFVGLLMYRNRG